MAIREFVRRRVAWLRRCGRSRGFGIQSPTAYQFLTDVLCQRLPYHAYDDLSKLHDRIMDGDGDFQGINQACQTSSNPDACVIAMKEYAEFGIDYTVNKLEERMETNKKTRDSYALARNLWFGFTAVSLTAAIVLFVW